MKKIILFLSLFLIVNIGIAQKTINIYNYTATAAGGTVNLPLNTFYNAYRVIGAPTLTASIHFNITGTPVFGTYVVIYYNASIVSSDTRTVSFFNDALYLNPYQSRVSQVVTGLWNGSGWEISLLQSSASTEFYLTNGQLIIPHSIQGVSIDTGAVSLLNIEPQTSGYIFQGTGTANVANALSGDATISNAGVLTISTGTITNAKLGAQAVTVDKVSTILQTEQVIVTVSFDSAEQGAYKIKMQYPGTVISVYAEAVKPISATDNGTVILKNNAGTTMTVTTPIVFTASDAFGTAYSSAITANNSFVDGDIITVNTAKTTAGGKVLVTLRILRN